MWPRPYGNFGSRKYMLASLDQSLHRMGLDYVDIFYSHRKTPTPPGQDHGRPGYCRPQWPGPVCRHFQLRCASHAGSRPDQLHQNIAALQNLEFTLDELEAIDRVLAAPA